ncbi:MAG: HAMP domain-containing protein [Gammaproteobacteria bacterium]|nr:HAMP domain-containing protein [Gammaproteobacteria bacterium]
MAFGKRIKKAFLTLVLVAGALLWLAALLLFSRVAENSDDFARWQNWVLLINSIGITALIVLISVNLTRLIRDLRRHVPGSRLKLRMITLLVALAVTPLLVVYVFSVAFINRGIDSWFSVDAEQGLENALTLSQTALDVQKRRNLEDLQRVAARLDAADVDDYVAELNTLRRDSEAVELTLFGANNRILATSSDQPGEVAPTYLTEETIFQLRQQRPYVSLEPLAGGQYQVVAALNLADSVSQAGPEVLQGRYAVEPRLSALANSVQESFNQYSELSFLRTPLKYGFTLTLSLVLLVSLLASVYGALTSARRLVGPIQQLMQGTRAVARGDFDTRLPIPARDEIGFLINSFNDMTQRLADARQEARFSEQKVESERRKLEVILARLSTGVVALEPDMRIRTANASAGMILNVDLEAHVGESLVDLAENRPLLAQFLTVSAAKLAEGKSEWREQIVLRGDVGRRVLMCACTALPGEAGGASGYVVVFDDVTALMQAQRDAAWGEVARRLAHEIKNPLTPIQLSAERLRRRYLAGETSDLDLLDRATHTIIQQVEAMKEMVNAFSQYAKQPAVEFSVFDLNDLISEITELYRSPENPVAIKFSFDANLPKIKADAGRMRQVFHNLMRNALEAMERQSDARVDISTRYLHRDGADAVEIKVADNGPGFVDDIVDQAFDPYVTSKPKGTGLGLAIVKKLVEEHGGQIKASNRQQGGAEISILLPISSETTGTPIVHGSENRRERA